MPCGVETPQGILLLADSFTTPHKKSLSSFITINEDL